MLDIVLVEPEIPHNTGAIARTCAATGARLHLIKPLGFDISDRAVKRCGLDYWYLVDISVYENLDEYFARNGDKLLYLATTKAPRAYAEADFSQGAALMFGKETAGLPEWLREKYRDRCIRIPTPSPYWPMRRCASRDFPACLARAPWPDADFYPPAPRLVRGLPTFYLKFL